MVGGVVSTVVIVCVHVLVLPHSSVATHTRVILPILPHAPTKLSVWLTVVVPHVSLAVAVPVAAGVVSPVHWTVLFVGHVMVGGVVSTVVIVCVQVLVLP